MSMLGSRRSTAIGTVGGASAADARFEVAGNRPRWFSDEAINTAPIVAALRKISRETFRSITESSLLRKQRDDTTTQRISSRIVPTAKGWRSLSGTYFQYLDRLRSGKTDWYSADPIVFGKHAQIFVRHHGVDPDFARGHERELDVGLGRIRLIAEDRDDPVARMGQTGKPIPCGRRRLTPVAQREEALVDLRALAKLFEPSDVVPVPLLIGRTQFAQIPKQQRRGTDGCGECLL